MPSSQSASGQPYLSEGMQVLVFLQQHFQGVAVPSGRAPATGSPSRKPGTGLHQPMGRLVRKLAQILDGAAPL